MRRLTYDDGSPREPWTVFEVGGVQHREPDNETMAMMLMDEDVIFIGSMLVNERTPCVLQAICSDTFDYACADSEPLTLGDLPVLFDMHESDPKWGAILWACKKRKMQPIGRLVDRMKEAGVWTDELEGFLSHAARHRQRHIDER